MGRRRFEINDVVEILALAQLNVKAGVLIDAMDSGRVGAAFVARAVF